MGSGRAKQGMREIDDTRQAVADDRFEEILNKVKAAGAEIVNDETSPIYSGPDEDDVEIGEQRVVEFNLSKFDFRITREVRYGKVEFDGRRREIVELPTPRIDLKLKRKPEISDQWVIVDLENFM